MIGIREQVLNCVWGYASNIHIQCLKVMENQTESEIWYQIMEQVRGQVWDKVGRQVEDQVLCQVSSQFTEAMNERY
jgi:hypothetical protein